MLSPDGETLVFVMAEGDDYMLYKRDVRRLEPLHAAGDLEGAIREYRAVLEIQPELPAVWFGLGNVLYAAGDLARAESAYREALEPDRGQPAVLAALGTTLGKAGDLDGGRALLREALVLDPALADAWNQLGILEEKGGDFPAARRAYRACLARRPEHADALFNAAKVSLRMGEPNQARDYLVRLRNVDPDYPLIPVLEQRLP